MKAVQKALAENEWERASFWLILDSKSGATAARNTQPGNIEGGVSKLECIRRRQRQGQDCALCKGDERQGQEDQREVTRRRAEQVLKEVELVGFRDALARRLRPYDLGHRCNDCA
eukprot:1486299-Amphidinium_carterae.1